MECGSDVVAVIWRGLLDAAFDFSVEQTLDDVSKALCGGGAGEDCWWQSVC